MPKQLYPIVRSLPRGSSFASLRTGSVLRHPSLPFNECSLLRHALILEAMPTLQTLDLLACALVGSVLVFIARRIRARKTSFPPGPPGSFVIGNALDFDPLCAWATFTEWKKTYGACFVSRVLLAPWHIDNLR